MLNATPPYPCPRQDWARLQSEAQDSVCSWSSWTQAVGASPVAFSGELPGRGSGVEQVGFEPGPIGAMSHMAPSSLCSGESLQVAQFLLKWMWSLNLSAGFSVSVLALTVGAGVPWGHRRGHQRRADPGPVWSPAGFMFAAGFHAAIWRSRPLGPSFVSVSNT